MRRARPITAIVLATAVSATALLAPAATTATATVAPLISPACLHAYEHERLAHPRLSDGAPPTALTSILGVLRRPATPADALTQSQLPNVFYSRLWIKSVRLLEIGADGVRYYLVPGIFDHPRPAACLLDLPAAERHADQLEDRQQRLGSVTVDATAPDIANSPALTRQAIEQGSPSFGLPSVTSSSASIYGIVPDGGRRSSSPSPPAGQSSAPSSPITSTSRRCRSTTMRAIRPSLSSGSPLAARHSRRSEFDSRRSRAPASRSASESRAATVSQTASQPRQI